jgi:hypothetical protein
MKFWESLVRPLCMVFVSFILSLKSFSSGLSGWFFGDFFIEDYPATLAYTGIYRYVTLPSFLQR